MAQPAPRPYPAFDAHPDEPDPVVSPAPARPAFGYLAAVDADEDRINLVHHHLAAHAQRAGLTLIEVYVDRNTDPDQPDRPGLALLVDEIANHPDAVLIIPGLAHLPTTRAAWSALDRRFAEVVTEIHTLDQGPIDASLLHPATRTAGDPTSEGMARAGGPWLTAEGSFEVPVQPEDTAASLAATLARLPAGARFAESFGDVETILVFRPHTASSAAEAPESV